MNPHMGQVQNVVPSLRTKATIPRRIGERIGVRLLVINVILNYKNLFAFVIWHSLNAIKFVNYQESDPICSFVGYVVHPFYGASFKKALNPDFISDVKSFLYFFNRRGLLWEKQ